MTRSKKILIYKLCCVVFALVLLFLPQRSFSYGEIRILATVLGIDGEDGNVQVSAQLAVPVDQNSGGQASTVAKADGGSIGEALENLEIGLGRRVDYGHLSSVVVGKDTKLKDIVKFLGYLMSSGKAGPGTYLVYCSVEPAADFIEKAQSIGESSDAEISSFIAYNRSGNHVAATGILEFLQGMHSLSHAAMLPCVELEDDAKDAAETAASQDGQAKNGAGDEESGGSKNKKLVAANVMAVMGGEKEEILLLDTPCTRGIVWQDPNSAFGLVELHNVQIDGRDISSVPARLTAKHVKRKASVERGENVFTYTIKIKLRLEDAQMLCEPICGNRTKKALEKEFESMVSNNLMEAVAFSKASGIDFLGIRDHFHKFCTKGYRNFDLSSVVVRVNVQATIQT